MRARRLTLVAAHVLAAAVAAVLVAVHLVVRVVAAEAQAPLPAAEVRVALRRAGRLALPRAMAPPRQPDRQRAVVLAVAPAAGVGRPRDAVPRVPGAGAAAAVPGGDSAAGGRRGGGEGESEGEGRREGHGRGRLPGRLQRALVPPVQTGAVGRGCRAVVCSLFMAVADFWRPATERQWPMANGQKIKKWPGNNGKIK